jgi:Cu-Zn family superoxide dismutase
MLRAALTTAILTSLALAGCASHDQAHDHGAAGAKSGGMGDGMEGHMGMMKGRVAIATLTPTQGNNVRGLVVFHQMDNGTLMAHVDITGLKPNGEHGFHVHEKGDCASTDGTSAGGHFNPDGKPHGPQGASHHAGDMPALKADANGAVDQNFSLSGPTVSDGPASLVGRSVIVHLSPDDYATQPTGNSGARIACGVIARH